MPSAKSGPHRAEPARPPAAALEPSQWGWAWAPAATAPPTRAPNERCAPPVTLAPDLPAQLGSAGLLDSGHGPQDGRRGGRSPSQGPRVSPVGQGGERGRGAATGQRGPSRGSRGPGSPLSTRPPPPPFCLPLGVAAAALRCRFPGCEHFPASLARGPKTGGFCPPAACRERRLRTAALRPLPFLRVRQRRPVSPAHNAAQGTRSCSWDQALARRSPRIYFSLFFQLSTFNGEI